MAAYEYRTEDKELVVERDFPMGEAPPFVELEDGRYAFRIYSWGGCAVLRGKGWARYPERDTAVFKNGPQ